MNLEDARELAEQEILARTGWSSLPHDAVLTHAYRSRRGRYVFQWKRKTDLYSSEVDRLLVWVRDDGSIEKVEISWFAPLEPTISENVERILRSRGYTVATASAQAIKEAVRRRAYEVTGKDIEVLEWRRILREAWVVEQPGDEFWVGKLSDDTYVLLNPDGEIVGWMILPTSALAVAGIFSRSSPCRGWCHSVEYVVAPRFKYWIASSGDLVYGLCPDYHPERGTCHPDTCKHFISFTDLINAIKDHRCKFYYAHAHGDFSCAWLGFVDDTDLYICAVEGAVEEGRAAVEELLADRGRMRLAILGHCGAMEQTGEGTFEYAFRKGQNEKTTVIGLKIVSTGGQGYEYWELWLRTFLYDLDRNKDKKIGDAYDDACDTYPDIRVSLDITGDRNQTLRDIMQGTFVRVTGG